MVRPVVAARSWWIGSGAAIFTAGALSLAAYGNELPAWVTTTTGVDKLLHVAVGGMLAFFLDGALARRSVALGRVRLPLAAVVILVPTAVEEFLQRYSTTRSSDPLDFAADVVGVALFTWLSRRAAV